jgi:hypothetical protein
MQILRSRDSKCFRRFKKSSIGAIRRDCPWKSLSDTNLSPSCGKAEASPPLLLFLLRPPKDNWFTPDAPVSDLIRSVPQRGSLMTGEKSMIEEYISQAKTTDYELLESTLDREMEIPVQRIRLRISEDDVELSAFGIMYTISLLSFLQGRPAGVSGIDYKENDVWSVEEFLRYLSFSHRSLNSYADYVHGRLMKTCMGLQAKNPNLISHVVRSSEPRFKNRLSCRWVRGGTNRRCRSSSPSPP